MKKYKVTQIVQCKVRVWYEVESECLEDALIKIGRNTSPTDKAIDGTDYEIVEDEFIKRTIIEEA
jgi:hypothetical protein